MSTTLDELWQMGESLKRLFLLDDAALAAALSQGFGDEAPEWTERLPRELWAISLVGTIKSTAVTLEQRLLPPGSEQTTQASVHPFDFTTRPLTDEEREALRRRRTTI